VTPLAPLPTLRRSDESRVVDVLDETIAHLRLGRPDVAISELTHAVQAALGYQPGPEVRERLDRIVALGGGFHGEEPRR
jgi:hypothetical protein